MTAAYKITRVENDGTRIPVTFTYDNSNLGSIIETDRERYDTEATYEVTRIEPRSITSHETIIAQVRR